MDKIFKEKDKIKINLLFSIQINQFIYYDTKLSNIFEL